MQHESSPFETVVWREKSHWSGLVQKLNKINKDGLLPSFPSPLSLNLNLKLKIRD